MKKIWALFVIVISLLSSVISGMAEDDRPLYIRGVMDVTHMDEDFEIQSDSVIERQIDPTITALDVRKAIESGDTTDLFHIPLDADVIELVRDGLIMPIGLSDALSADVQEMTPAVKEALFDNGVLYAVPSVMLAKIWKGEFEIPATYAELLNHIDSLAIAWGNESIWSKRDYVNALLETFISESIRNSGNIDFCSEVFAETLKKLKKAELPSALNSDYLAVINPAEIIDLGNAFTDALPKNAGKNDDPGTNGKDDPQWLLPPTVMREAEPSVPVRMYVYVINAHAQNTDKALQYLEYMVSHRDSGDEGLLKPDNAEAVFYSESNVWAITEKRLMAYKETCLPYLDMRMHPLFSLSAKQEGGTYFRMLEIVMEYVEGNAELDICQARLEHIMKDFSHEKKM